MESFMSAIDINRLNAVQGAPRALLRLEGAALLAAAVGAYANFHGSWLLFAMLFLAPDLSFVAYAASALAGALAYNALHTTLAPLALLGFAFALDQPLARDVALIWIAHVGFDRAMGYGLKYSTAFGDTHLGRIGR
jgi:hypothetical protein